MRASIALVALLFLIGCASFNTNAGKSLASIAVSVDTAMKGWATYVAVNQISKQQQTKVKMAYENYQFAMDGAEKAYIALVKTGDRSAWLKASEALAASQSSILLIISQATGKAKP